MHQRRVPEGQRQASVVRPAPAPGALPPRQISDFYSPPEPSESPPDPLSGPLSGGVSGRGGAAIPWPCPEGWPEPLGAPSPFDPGSSGWNGTVTFGSGTRTLAWV